MIPQTGFQRGCSLIGRILNRKSISHPSNNTDTTTTRMASNSPKFRCLRSGSRRLPTRLKILMVAKPNTSAHRMLYTSPFLVANCQSDSSNQCGWKGQRAHETSEMTRAAAAVEDKTMTEGTSPLEQMPPKAKRKTDITLSAARSQRKRALLVIKKGDYKRSI